MVKYQCFYSKVCQKNCFPFYHSRFSKIIQLHHSSFWKPRDSKTGIHQTKWRGGIDLRKCFKSFKDIIKCNFPNGNTLSSFSNKQTNNFCTSMPVKQSRFSHTHNAIVGSKINLMHIIVSTLPIPHFNVYFQTFQTGDYTV